MGEDQRLVGQSEAQDGGGGKEVLQGEGGDTTSCPTGLEAVSRRVQRQAGLASCRANFWCERPTGPLKVTGNGCHWHYGSTAVTAVTGGT